MNIDFPYQIDNSGRTGSVTEDGHIRDMIEQVLFTNPGERVNRPEFGSGLMQVVFGPNSDELATATELTVQGSLQRWLGDRVQINSVNVVSEEATLTVTIEYVLRRTQERQTVQFERGF